jgi:hypothetical protein
MRKRNTFFLRALITHQFQACGGYLDLRKINPVALAKEIETKLGGRQRRHYLPPILDRLKQALDPSEPDDDESISVAARSLYQSLEKMTLLERRVVCSVFMFGCPAELPENIHINLDLLRRETGVSVVRLKTVMGAVSSLGFTSYIREDDETEGRLGKNEMLVVEYVVLSSDYEPINETQTGFAYTMMTTAAETYCSEHGMEALLRLDFHQLGRSTYERHNHSRTGVRVQPRAKKKRK